MQSLTDLMQAGKQPSLSHVAQRAFSQVTDESRRIATIVDRLERKSQTWGSQR